MSRRTILTTWECFTYDVWGNARDGWDVNDRYPQGKVTLRIPVTVNNPGTPQEFLSATPGPRQLAALFGRRIVSGMGDDLTIYLEDSRNGKPRGEMHCTSHESLSPIRVKAPASVA